MPISFACTGCKKPLKVKDELAGKKVKCPGCGTLVTAPGGKPAAGPAGKPAPKKTTPPKPSKEWPLEDEEDAGSPPPRGKPPRLDEDDLDAPPRKTKPDEDEEDDPFSSKSSQFLDDDEEEAPPRKKPGRPVLDDDDDEPAPPRKKSARPVLDDDDLEDEEEPPPKRRKSRGDGEDDDSRPGKKKGKGGLLLILLLVLLLVCGGAAAAWFFFFNQPDNRPGVGPKPTKAATAPVPEDKRITNDLKALGLAYREYWDINLRAPAQPEDLKPYLDKLPGGNTVYQDLKDGRYVFIYNVGFTQMKAPPSDSILAYEKDSPAKGGVAVFGDGVVHYLTPDEFQTKPRAEKRPPPKAGGTFVDLPIPEGATKVELMPLVDLKQDVLRGRWSMDNNLLVCEEANFIPCIQIPYQPPAEYDFVVSFSQWDLRNGVSLIMPNPTGGSFFWCVGSGAGNNYLLSSKKLTDKDPGNLLKPDATYTTVVQVRKDSVKAYLEGKLLLDHPTDYADLKDEHRKLKDQSLVGVACDDPTVFYRIFVIELGEPGKKTREK